jgi:hypothetical protein|tara:strand:+ start:1968 stop:2264 length:297 start_codon:yes stop_codon:yes gene_type:complete
MTQTATTLKVTFMKMHTDDTSYEEWAVECNGNDVGFLTRDRAVRWAEGARRGLVADRSSPYDYDFDDEGRDLKISIPSGSTLREAKRIVRAAVQKNLS